MGSLGSEMTEHPRFGAYLSQKLLGKVGRYFSRTSKRGVEKSRTKSNKGERRKKRCGRQRENSKSKKKREDDAIGSSGGRKNR
jgi:hypothetical protein